MGSDRLNWHLSGLASNFAAFSSSAWLPFTRAESRTWFPFEFSSCVCLKETFEIHFFFPLSWHTLIAEMPPSTPCGNNLAENPPGLHVIVPHHPTPSHPTSAQPPSSTKPGGICLSVLTKTSLAALTSAPSDTSGWTECRLRSGTYRLFAALVATKKPIPVAIVLYLFNFFSFLSFLKLAKDEVTMLQWVIHLEFMFSGSYFHLRAYLLVGCLYVRFMSHLARLCFSCFFFLPHRVHTSFPQHLQYLLFSGWGDFFFQ